MGIYDYITCEVSIPKYGDISHIEGQTKRFFRNFGKFTITSDGELIQHLDKGLGRDLHQAENQSTRRLLFHGDMMFSIMPDERVYIGIVARFTHGQLESIRLIEDLSKEEQLLLYTPQE